MGDRWIITKKNYKEHLSLAKAQRELARLSTTHPEDTFRVLHVKTSLERSASGKVIYELRTALAALVKVHREQDTCGVAPADKAVAYDRAESILAKLASNEVVTEDAA